ncbi:MULTISPECIES: GntR family transcriptional regulator [Pseudoalteromonas]|uniref:GntR family transcriptional regulator n=1 Tax=Pseudoalteromonas piscicida TaxID=43662 RepID=A0AAD0RGQ3_PSEO7|nr:MULTISPECIES: GntR family transcriptional regulator [Pseudoalteromonas]ASD66920.1 GntR family transcriptional regulator [Pseudoalteromonas piscicida]AUJ69907.1 HTH-type transcriptional regulator McbR [Pseudoalteromonas sp. NC201]AXQ97843.1 GntR family transcriptional regulator [Pseudoalteromonas piscicida]AXR02370.1 GntR family transcriptional regulator [Pseudoalteromonas piscicida]MBR8844709.1 GntR family transcriptional regulator [Pseudoalteromonas sp. JC3]
MAIVHKTRTQLVAEAIREKILTGEIKAGEPLRQAALADELNVSRIPVREALLQLEAEGLVNFEAHKGATVTRLSAEQIDEIFDLRALLEAELLCHSIDKLTARDLLEAEAILAELEEAMAAGDTQLATGKLNAEFHSKLYSKAQRPQTRELVDVYSKNSERYVRMHILLAGGIKTAPDEHRQLLELCRDKNTKGACDFLKKHITGAKDDIKALLLKLESEQ